MLEVRSFTDDCGRKPENPDTTPDSTTCTPTHAEKALSSQGTETETHPAAAAAGQVRLVSNREPLVWTGFSCGLVVQRRVKLLAT